MKNIDLYYRFKIMNVVHDYMRNNYITPCKSYLSLEGIFNGVCSGLNIPKNKMTKSLVLQFLVNEGFEFKNLNGNMYVCNIGISHFPKNHGTEAQSK